MIDYTITVGATSYNLGIDFEYTGVATVTAIGAPFTPGVLGILQGSKEGKFIVGYMYDFSAISGGIEGSLEMLAIVAEEGVMHIRSLRGTARAHSIFRIVQLFSSKKIIFLVPIYFF